MKFILQLLVFVLIFGCKKDKDTIPSGPPVNQDAYFVMQASLATYTAIQLSHITGTISSDPDILSFADRIRTEQTLYRQTLIDLADSLNLQVADSLDPAHLSLRNYLLTISGREFDSVYIHNQVQDLAATINLHQTEISFGSNDMVKSFATVHLQEIQEQKALADSIAANF
jgi:predicted outer membrane protein